MYVDPNLRIVQIGTAFQPVRAEEKLMSHKTHYVWSFIHPKQEIQEFKSVV